MVSMGWSDSLARHQEIVAASEGLGPVIDRAVRMIRSCFDRGSRLYACGNGGSHAHAVHLVAELVVRYRISRPAYPALALGCNASSVTATCNDFSAVTVFERELEAFGRYGDVLVAISTSGTSANVLRAIECARGKGLVTIGLTGQHGMAAPVACEIRVPSTDTPRIQELHMLIIHALCESLDAQETT